MNSIEEQLASILNGYAAISQIPNHHDTSLELAIKQIKTLFGYEEVKSLEGRKLDFHKECIKLVKEDRSNIEELTHFYHYWTEHPTKITIRSKMKFEKESTFNISGRYATWQRQSKKFSIVNMLNKRG